MEWVQPPKGKLKLLIVDSAYGHGHLHSRPGYAFIQCQFAWTFISRIHTHFPNSFSIRPTFIRLFLISPSQIVFCYWSIFVQRLKRNSFIITYYWRIDALLMLKAGRKCCRRFVIFCGNIKWKSKHSTVIMRSLLKILFRISVENVNANNRKEQIVERTIFPLLTTATGRSSHWLTSPNRSVAIYSL